MTRTAKRISRRTALIKLGLVSAAIYYSPTMTTLSAARAASGPGSGGTQSSATSASSAPSAPSASSAPSAPSASAPSASSAPSAPSASAPSVPSAGENAVETSAAPSGCSGPNGAERASISRRDMARANAAVARGEAKPLREIVHIVRQQYPGRLIRVGFNNKSGAPSYWLQIVSSGGSVQTVTVEAGSGQVTGMKGC